MAMRWFENCVILLSASLSVTTAAFAQSDYPKRPVHIIVPGAPGAGFDIVSRVMAPGLSESLGKQVVVENRAGAGTIIGTDIVAKAAPDGHTLLMCASAHAIHPALHKKMPYDGMRDFAPITQTALVPNLMVMHASLPAASVKDVIALARARPGDILFASAGRGASSHVSMVLFGSMAKIRMTHVPYKGTTPGVVDLLAGNVTIMAASTAALLPHVRRGKLRALGVTSARRVSVAPEIPTISEAGLPGYEAVNWFGLLAPAGTPQDIIDRLHKEAVAILQSPSVKARITADGTEVVTSSPQEFAAFLQAERLKWGRLLRAAGITPE